jgi:hypothetical protein
VSYNELAPVTLTPEQQAQLRRFWPTWAPIRVLASRWGCTEAHVSTQAKRMGLPRRADRRGGGSRSYLAVEALKRGMDEGRLIQFLLDVIVKDKLVVAILDDGEAHAN